MGADDPDATELDSVGALDLGRVDMSWGFKVEPTMPDTAGIANMPDKWWRGAECHKGKHKHEDALEVMMMMLS